MLARAKNFARRVRRFGSRVAAEGFGRMPRRFRQSRYSGQFRRTDETRADARFFRRRLKRYGADALVGAGTILDAETARRCVDAGARFIISPAFDAETVEFCVNQETVVMPGALTPTEIVAAWAAGADFVKVFPAGALGGASYLKALKAPLPHINLIPTGGVSMQNAADFIRAGASAVGVGADLVDLRAMRENRGNEITQRARQYLEIVKKARLNL